VNEVIVSVKNSGGIEYATTRMNEYKTAALEILQSFPGSPSLAALHELVNFTTERKK
jgi:octaprenyl-diphosphate synthase